METKENITIDLYYQFRNIKDVLVEELNRVDALIIWTQNKGVISPLKPIRTFKNKDLMEFKKKTSKFIKIQSRLNKISFNLLQEFFAEKKDYRNRRSKNVRNI